METSPTNKGTYAFFSPKGGVGTSTIAVNLAISLQRLLNEEVLLIDGKHLFGHLALYCNIRTNNSMTDLIVHAGSLDEHLIKQVAVKHHSGIHVLPSPSSIVEAQGIKAKDLFKVMQGIKSVFPYIIIDCGNNLNENTVTYMDISDQIFLILNPDLASMRDVRQFLDLSATNLSYPKEKTQLILNFSGRKEDIKSDEIEKILNKDIFGRVPYDTNLALSSINEGVPIYLKKPRHPISKAINEVANDLTKAKKFDGNEKQENQFLKRKKKNR